MLESNDRDKIEKYIEKLIRNIDEDVRKNIKPGISNREIIERTVNVTVNKVTPESKMLLSSIYNMLMEKTLSGSLYQEPQNKASFYARDILKELNSRFTFEVPNHIDYEENSKLINKWTATGAIVVGGGIISITMKNGVPVAIAVVIAGIMLFLLGDKNLGGSQHDMNILVKDYLNNVKLSLVSWVNEIEKFYDREVEKLEKEISQ